MMSKTHNDILNTCISMIDFNTGKKRIAEQILKAYDKYITLKIENSTPQEYSRWNTLEVVLEPPSFREYKELAEKYNVNCYDLECIANDDCDGYYEIGYFTQHVEHYALIVERIKESKRNTIERFIFEIFKMQGHSFNANASNALYKKVNTLKTTECPNALSIVADWLKERYNIDD